MKEHVGGGTAAGGDSRRTQSFLSCYGRMNIEPTPGTWGSPRKGRCPVCVLPDSSTAPSTQYVLHRNNMNEYRSPISGSSRKSSKKKKKSPKRSWITVEYLCQRFIGYKQQQCHLAERELIASIWGSQALSGAQQQEELKLLLLALQLNKPQLFPYCITLLKTQSPGSETPGGTYRSNAWVMRGLPW